MDKRSRKRSSSDEGEKSEARELSSEDAMQSVLLEDEIKKIISGLDIKFDDSPPEDDENGTSTATTISLPFPNPHTGFENELSTESQHKRLESASTISGATTVVQQTRVPLKMMETHVQSCRLYPSGDPNTSNNDLRGLSTPTQRGDDVTESTSEIQPSSTDHSTSTARPATSSHEQSSSAHLMQHSYVPPAIKPSPAQMHLQTNEYYQPTVNVEPPTRPVEYQRTNFNAGSYLSHQPPLVDPSRCPYTSTNVRQDKSSPQYFPTPYAQHPQRPSNGNTQRPQQLNENVDRYNNTHMTYSNGKGNGKPRRSLTDYFFTKSRSIFNKRDESDSGEIVPQLYRASIKKGITPQRFTFKAVTGCQLPCIVPSESISSIAVPQPRYSNPCLPECEKPLAMATNDESNEQCDCCAAQDNPKKCSYQRSSLKNWNYDSNDGLKAKAYFHDLGCGYISQNSVPEKVDIYCFDQLNTGFFRTSDHPPPLLADIAVQRAEKFATVFWAEIFGVVNIFTALIIAMILQTFKFLLQGIVRPIMIGFVQLLSDYLIKPLLTLLYNGFTQPISIFLYNVIASLRDVMQPLAKGLGYFFELIALIFRAIRIIEVKNVTNISPCNPPALKC